MAQGRRLKEGRLKGGRLSGRRRERGKKRKQKKRRGRPVVKEWPDQIPDTPENVALAVLTTLPKEDDEWAYMKRHKKPKKNRERR